MKIIMIDDDREGALALKQIIEKKVPLYDVEVYDDSVDIQSVCQKSAPEIILLDIQMPKIDGITLCKKVKAFDQGIKVIMFTSFKIKKNIKASIESGCDALVYKHRSSDELIQIMGLVRNGTSVFDENISELLMDVNFEILDEVREEEKSILSERELMIVQLITLGKTNSEISKTLFLSEGYIRNQLVEIRNKLNLRNSKELAAWGAKLGL